MAKTGRRTRSGCFILTGKSHLLKPRWELKGFSERGWEICGPQASGYCQPWGAPSSEGALQGAKSGSRGAFSSPRSPPRSTVKLENATSFDTWNRRPARWCVYQSAEGRLKLGALPLTILQVGWWNPGDVDGREDSNTRRGARLPRGVQTREVGVLSGLSSWLHTQLQTPFSVNFSFTKVFTAVAKGGRSAGRRQ